MSSDPLGSRNLTALVPAGSTSTAVHPPSPDAIVALLAARYKQELTATWIGDSTLAVVNPLRVLSDVSEASKAEYEERCYDVRTGRGGETVQPHAFELACRVFLLMRRTGETQSVVFSGLSASGGSTQSSLFTAELLRLSAVGKREIRIAEQVHALETVLASFGAAKTTLNPSASRHSTFLELHFTSTGKLAGAKALAFGLDKTRVSKLSREERTYHCFYQLLAGATHEERVALHLLDDFTSYDLFESSGCYRLPAGPGSDDSIAFDELRNAMKVLGFKARHVSSILRLLSTILLLGNIRFEDRGERDLNSESAWVANHDVLDTVAALLGIEAEDLERGLTNKLRWVRKETVSVILKAEASVKQRDALMESLYSILFTFVVETANHRLFPGDDEIAQLQAAGGSSILQLNTPGFHSRVSDRPGSGMLVRALNGFEEFSINYANEAVHFWMAEHAFDGDSGVAARAQEDGVRMADVIPSDGSARLELLRGGRIGGKADRKPGGLLGGLSKTCHSVRKGSTTDEADEELLRGMKEHFGTHTAFVPSPGGPGADTAFGISHFAGTVAYDATGFIERNMDALDSQFVALFRTSEDGFISKLFAGPSLAAEVHPLDPNTIVAAQVSSQPLRRPSTFVASASAPHSDIDHTAPLLDPLEIHPLTSQLNATLAQLLNLMDRTQVWSVLCLRPNDSGHPGIVDTKRLRAQVSAYLIPELVARKKVDFIHAIDYNTFNRRHGVEGPGPEAAGQFLVELGLDGAGDSALGTRQVWLSYHAWKATEDRLRVNEPIDRRRSDELPALQTAGLGQPFASSRSAVGEWGDLGSAAYGGDSADDLLLQGQSSPSPFVDVTCRIRHSDLPLGGAGERYADSLAAPAPYIQASSMQSDVWGSDKEAPAGFTGHQNKEGVIDSMGRPQEKAKGVHVEVIPTSRGRMLWVIIVWACTWWIPSFLLTYLGRMKRPDVRMAWREKVTLCMLIGTFCAIVVFYIVVFGKLICPGYDKANNSQEVAYHQGTNDYWVSVRGNVYDLTNFYKLQHSSVAGEPSDTTDMLSLAGQDLSNYFPIPLTLACPTLISDATLSLQYTNFSATVATAVHTSGSQSPFTSNIIHDQDWYTAIFLPKMRRYYKGPLVWAPSKIATQADGAGRMWAIYKGGVYDLTDYFNTIIALPSYTGYAFLDSTLSDLWQQEPGKDITSAVAALKMDPAVFATNLQCIQNLFYVGETDFRLSPKCQVQPYLLLTFSIILVTTIFAKFLAALQLGSKRSPELRDKFVICQVPCYTEGEESLKKTIDSLATLTYDDKRKLLMIICDGMIIGSGNDRPTPRIVLDIFGVDQTVDPDPLMFKSVGEGSKQLNYGKVWSGLYEVDGHVVPYVVVAKCGRPSERSKPGNRGKRDSQILAMRFLNRVHFDSEMYPLELEMYHQIKNVIGVDPQLYEYMLVIDADTSVAADSLNRLVSCAADDSRIIGICGETKLENEQASWWTMIQVYEYFISHHMSKAFESLFGSVTCLPGCFTMYRIRSADKGKPLLVSSLIIDEYSVCNLDTLHKKNLLALGEDRYLTTLILKHFPNYKTKFTADAQAMTVAPDRWSILLSQRRRWINSTVHNLAELMFLPDMCGFCCFGMRFIVVIDLVGTLILPATFVYLIYLIVSVSTGSGAIPVISLIMLGAVYGFQIFIFLLKRQWQFIGWLIIYIIAYPVYSFILPVYSFWCFDDFTWGNTRVVVGEGKSKKVLQADDEVFEESMIPMKKFSDYQAAMLEEDDNRSIHSVESRRTQSTAGFSLATRLPAASYHGGADYYRDTNQSRQSSRSNMAAFLPPSPSYAAGYGTQQGSVRGGSEFGYPNQARNSFQPPTNQSRNSFAPSNYGQQPMMPAMVSRQSMMSLGAPQMGMPNRDSTMSGFSNFGGTFPPNNFAMIQQQRPMSTFSSANPFMSNSPTSATISDSTSPTDDELVATLRSYLAHQDLMAVTKRTARDGLQALYPQADLAPRKDFINASIDGVLQGRL